MYYFKVIRKYINFLYKNKLLIFKLEKFELKKYFIFIIKIKNRFVQKENDVD